MYRRQNWLLLHVTSQIIASLLCTAFNAMYNIAGNDARANHASGIQAPLTRVVATPCYRAPEVDPACFAVHLVAC